MDLSVVVATLNGRDALAESLDALAAAAPASERIVVNGPSADGTTGMVRDRDDVHVLLELADRNVNVARNAGVESATGGAVAFVDGRTAVGEGWTDALESALSAAPVVTGPVRRPLPVGTETSRPERERVGGREVTYFDGANAAFLREAIDAIDGFDEYLTVGGARDAAHRLAGLELGVAWSGDLQASRDATGADPMGDGSSSGRYRALAYRLVKNYGLSPGPLRCVAADARRGATAEIRAVLSGDVAVSELASDGVGAGGTSLRGVLDGLRARLADRRPARNPNGLTSRADRVVQRYDWR